MMTVPQLACAAFNLDPAGGPAKEAFTCVQCAGEFGPGSPKAPFVPGASFTDDASLVARDRPMSICGWCAIVCTRAVMQQLLNVAVSPAGVFRVARKEHRLWLLQGGLEPPFAILLADTKLAHLAWRTPLTLSNDLLLVRMSNRTFSVDMKVVRSAVEACRAISERWATEAKFTTPPRHPFRRLDWLLSDMETGQLNPNARKHATPEELTLLFSLGLGELWALACLAGNLVPAEKPERITL